MENRQAGKSTGRKIQSRHSITTYTDAGEVYSLIGEHEKSKQAFEKALAINEALFEEEPENPIYEMNQVETFEKYAKLLSKLGRDKEAEDYIIKSNEIYRKLAEEDSSEGDIDEKDI